MKYEEYYKWYDEFVEKVNASLSEFHPRNDQTGENVRFRRYYIMGDDLKEHFVVHLRAVPTKNRINVMFGLDESILHTPEGCPALEFRDKSVPHYREYNLIINDTKVEGITLELIKQTANYFRNK